MLSQANSYLLLKTTLPNGTKLNAFVFLTFSLLIYLQIPPKKKKTKKEEFDDFINDESEESEEEDPIPRKSKGD